MLRHSYLHNRVENSPWSITAAVGCKTREISNFMITGVTVAANLHVIVIGIINTGRLKHDNLTGLSKGTGLTFFYVVFLYVS